MKKIKDDLEDELQRERSAHRHYKRECSALKDEYNNLRLKVELIIYSSSLHMSLYVFGNDVIIGSSDIFLLVLTSILTIPHTVHCRTKSYREIIGN